MVAQVSSCYKLGDVVSVEGTLQLKKERLSLLVQQIRIEEAWCHVFGKALFLFDWEAAANFGMQEGTDANTTLLLQLAGSCR